ncbi:MAG: sulfoxide reductase catalytic subunit YedY, partial [Colwellia sp.]
MLIKSPAKSSLKEHQVTDESVYLQRRQLVKNMGFIGAGTLISSAIPSVVHGKGLDFFSSEPTQTFQRYPLNFTANSTNNAQVLTPEAKVTSHNNFYEFGTNKSDPVNNAQSFNVNPWKLTISGECDKPYTLDLDALTKSFVLEERIYRLRCVEAWSMVIPWVGFELAKLLKKAQPNSRAKYVAFETLYDPEQMPGQASRRLGGGVDYPYVEGLRIDEAMNPLALMSVGLYGKTLPAQNGAPIRLVVPWK